MKQKKRWAALLVAWALLVSMFAGTVNFRVADAAKKVKISNKKIVLKVGQKKKLKVKNTKKKVKWSSNKKKVASVTKKGVVKAKKKGTATITAKVGKKKYKCKVTVKPKKAKKSTSKPKATSTSKPTATSKPGTSLPADEDDLTFSKESGTYADAFTLTLKSKTGHTIYYTTDGSDPRTSSTRKQYTNGISIRSRKGDANVLSAISPNEFATMSTRISGTSIISTDQAPSSASAVDKCSVVRAVLVDQGGAVGTVLTKTYFIGDMSDHIAGVPDSVEASGEKLSVMSITVDAKDLFDYDTGIYVRGKYFDESLKEYLASHNNSLSNISVEGDLTSNFKQKGRAWERNCHISYFETDGANTVCQLQQDCGIRIQGNYSRENVQKSFRLYAREDYGTKNFKYPFFDGLQNAAGETMKKFKTLVLRNGGNDVLNYKYKDILTQSFVHDLEQETLHGRPCVVYLNGEYWGYYILQDDLSDNFLEERRGVVKEDVIAYKATDEKQYAQYRYKLDVGDLPAGETSEDYYLKETLNYLRNNDFSDDEVYQKFIEDYMSEQSALDYFATVLFLNNGWDWPGKNWEIWRTIRKDSANPYADGRWRFCLFDLDLTTEPTWADADTGEWKDDTIAALYNKNSSNVIQLIFSNMLDNAAFREKLSANIMKLGTENYAYDAVSARAEQYRKTYSPLHDQFQTRYVFGSYSTYIAQANHEANLSFYHKRMTFIPTMLENMEARYAGGTPSLGGGDFSTGGSVATPDPVDGKLVWEGKWTRGGSGNLITSQTKGLSAYSDSANYIALSVSNWSQFTNPVIKLYVADGYAANARTHIWDNSDKNIMDAYYYQSSVPQGQSGGVGWIEQEISIAALRGKTIYVNANDATLTKIEIYDQK